MFLWTKQDSKNLERITNALEEIAGKKTFVPRDGKLNIEMVEENDEEAQEEERKTRIAVNDYLEKNEGNHLWEEENLPIAVDDEYS